MASQTDCQLNSIASSSAVDERGGEEESEISLLAAATDVNKQSHSCAVIDSNCLGTKSDDDVDTSCGIRSWRPKWIQKCANIQLFTAVTCLLACTNGAISASYLPSVITTIEKRYELGSLVIGLVVASYEVGATIAVIFVSYLGDRRSIPGIIGVGTLLVGTGTCLFSLPHFISQPYSVTINENVNQTLEKSCLGEPSLLTSDGHCTEDELRSGTELYVVIFIISQSFIGIGSAPILTSALSYIDSHVSKTKSPQYLAFVYASATLGPVLGFGCGAALMELYVDFLKPSVIKQSLTSSDPQWVGAWWVGFLIFGVLTVLNAPPFFAFPKKLPQNRKELQVSVSEEATTTLHCSQSQQSQTSTHLSDTQQTSYSTLKQFPKAVMKLLKNPVYMLLNVATVFEMVIVTGFITFVPKYIETQFDTKTSQANLYTGSVAVPGAALGILSSGMLLKHLKLTPKGAIQLTIILSVLCLACFSMAFIFGCDNAQIAGVTVPYFNSMEPIKRLSSSTSNLTNECNSDCSCPANVYIPVCGPNSITYFSSCHAGCKVFSNDTLQSCACIESELVPGQVEAGACTKHCGMLIPFILLVLAISFLIAALKTPITMVTIRCVEEDMRSFSLGIQMVMIRVCALLPAPIIFGNIIDTTCLWWKYECGKRKNCLIYNVEAFRYKYGGICAGLHLFGMLTFVACWYVMKRQNISYESETPADKGELYDKKSSSESRNTLSSTDYTIVGSTDTSPTLSSAAPL